MTEKIIKMDYKEYEDMKKLITLQQKSIEDFLKSDKIILIDNRYNYFHYGYKIIPIIITNEKLAKEYLVKEFDDLKKQFHDTIYSLKKEIDNLKNKPKKWYQKLR